MNTVTWIVQGLLALALLAAGGMKFSQTKEQLMAWGNMDWTEDFPEGQIKGIGALEVLAALGLILPAVLDIAPELVGVAAIGVVLLMLGAPPLTSAAARSRWCPSTSSWPPSPCSSRSCVLGPRPSSPV